MLEILILFNLLWVELLKASIELQVSHMEKYIKLLSVNTFD